MAAFRTASGRTTRTARRTILTPLPLLLLIATPCSADVRMSTWTFKKVGNLEIRADVFRDEGDTPQPVLVWLHGGALIVGNRSGIDRRFKKEFAGNGCILVSLDYRLAPETLLPEIIGDVEDGLRWVREKGPALFHADPERIAIAGGSAGGYLTLTAGFRVKPRPVALAPLFGYGDLLASWYNEPSPHPRHNQSKISREEALRQVSGPPIADDRDRKGNGGKFYVYCRQQGTWPLGVSQWDPKTVPEKFFPYMPIKNVTADYPPTFLIHGDHDTDVPHSESVRMAAELERNRVDHKLVILENGEHGFGGADPRAVDAAYAEAFAFLNTRLLRSR